MRAVSTARRLHFTSPMKSMHLGRVHHVTLCPSHSSGSKLIVEPSSILPRRFVVPAANISASANEVFPVPPCPRGAILCIFLRRVIFHSATSLRWALLAAILSYRFLDGHRE